MVRPLDRILEIGTVPETPSSGPRTVGSSSSCLLFSVLSPPGCTSQPLPWGPRVLGKEARSRASDRCRAWTPAGGVRGCGRRRGRARGREDGVQRALPPRPHVPWKASLCSSQTLLPKLLFIKLTLLGAEETAWNKTPGRIYSSLASGYHKLSFDYGGESVSSPHTAPAGQDCFLLSFQPCSLFSKQDLNHRPGDCSEVESIFITVSRDLRVTHSQMYWVAERRPEYRTFKWFPVFFFPVSCYLLVLGVATLFS